MSRRQRSPFTFQFPLVLFCAGSAAAQVLSYSTYLGSAGNPPIAVNANGEQCIGGSFFTKLRSDGAVVYSISNPNVSSAVAIDSQGNCYYAGQGSITPTAGAFQSTPKSNNLSPQFLQKLDGSGNVVYATYLGGSGSDFPGGLAVDDAGNAFVTGETSSNDFPTKNAFQAKLASTNDAYITVLNASGKALVYSTYWGGNGDDYGNSIAADIAGNAYITGATVSTNFPLVAPFQATYLGTQDAFVIKLDPSGKPIYSTYLGGQGNSNGRAIAADVNGSAYIAGYAPSGFPLVVPIQSTTTDSSAFVSKLSPDGSTLIYSTYLGEQTAVLGISVDSNGQTYVGGVVETSGSVPLVSPIQSTYGRGSNDGFVSVINASGTALLFSSYLGGDSDAVFGLGIDSVPSIYLAGWAEAAFPIVNAADGVYIPFHACFTVTCVNRQGFAMKIDLSSGASLSYPAEADFTPVPQPVGTSTAQPAPVLLANTGAFASSIAISNIAIQGDFSQTNNCPNSLVPASKCTFQVIFSPTAAGTRTGTITITDTAPRSPHIINLVGTGAIPQVSLAPASLTFASQTIGTTSPAQVVTLSNVGGATLMISAVNISGDFSETNSCGSTVGTVNSCQISVVFAPTATGSRTGTLSIVDNAPGSPHTVSLSGTGATPSIGLGVPPGGSNTATVTAGSTATYTLSIGGSGVSGSASLSCANAPKGANCILPNTANVDATTPSNFTVTVTTTARSMLALSIPGFNRTSWFWALAFTPCVVLSVGRRRRRSTSRSGRFFQLISTLQLILLLSSCGAGGAHQNPNGTTAGTYNLVVSAKIGSDTQSTVLTLIVQ